MAKERVDKLLVDRGLAETRERAQRLIMAGRVFSGDAAVDKPGSRLATDAPLEVRGEPHPFVSRGGAKLDGALTAFAIDVADCVALDVGASTGGFTDCLLQRGRAAVYAVDVGYGQLAWKLRHRSAGREPRAHERARTSRATTSRADRLVDDRRVVHLAPAVLLPWSDCSIPGRAHRRAREAAVRGRQGRVGKGGWSRDVGACTPRSSPSAAERRDLGSRSTPCLRRRSSAPRATASSSSSHC
jgi:23S rRNA (cytidine1920-2'-O)/16S rRNA (cytidine1409-2'-O)-methyltransferase